MQSVAREGHLCAAALLARGRASRRRSARSGSWGTVGWLVRGGRRRPGSVVPASRPPVSYRCAARTGRSPRAPLAELTARAAGARRGQAGHSGEYRRADGGHHTHWVSVIFFSKRLLFSESHVFFLSLQSAVFTQNNICLPFLVVFHNLFTESIDISVIITFLDI